MCVFVFPFDLLSSLLSCALGLQRQREAEQPEVIDQLVTAEKRPAAKQELILCLRIKYFIYHSINHREAETPTTQG